MFGIARIITAAAFLAFVLTGSLTIRSDAQARFSGPLTFGPLKGDFFGGGDGPLFVLLHGDLSGGGTADYMYSMAREIVAKFPGSSVGVIFRPGYCGAKGKCSPDPHGHKKWDHYTAENIELVKATIKSLISWTDARTVIGIGHSGGAAMLAVIFSESSTDLVDKAVLVACPCNLGEWDPNWIRSEDPVKYVDLIHTETPIVLIHGTDDPKVNDDLSRLYGTAVINERDAKTKCLANRLDRCGVKVVLYPGANHSFNDLKGEILDELKLLMP